MKRVFIISLVLINIISCREKSHYDNVLEYININRDNLLDKEDINITTLVKNNHSEFLKVELVNYSSPVYYYFLNKETEYIIIKDPRGFYTDSLEYNSKDKVVNKDNFNQAVKLFCPNISKDSIITIFLGLLSNIDINDGYMRVDKIEDISKIYKKYPIKENNFFDNTCKEKSFVFNADYVYCWFIEKGIVQFQFEFTENLDIKTVKSKNICNLSNEILPM